jgi:hypothetical protein
MSPNELLIQATKDQNITTMKEALDQGAIVNCRDAGGLTTLHLSVLHEHEEGIELLLNAGAKVDEQDSRGQTPLHMAVTTGMENLVRKLLKRHASIGIYDTAGLQPIHLAVTAGYREIIRLLLIEGAELISKTKGQKTAIELAESLGQGELVIWLEEQSNQIKQLRLETELKQDDRIEQLEEEKDDQQKIVQEKAKENVALRQQIESMQRQIATFKSLLKEKFTFKPKPRKAKAVAELESQADSEQPMEDAPDLGKTIQTQVSVITQLEEEVQKRDAAIEALQAALVGPTAPSDTELPPITPPEEPEADDSTITTERAKALAARIIQGAIDGLGVTATTRRLGGIRIGGKLNSKKKERLHRVLCNRIQSSRIELTSEAKEAELIYGLSVYLQQSILELKPRESGFRISDTNHIHCKIPADEIEYSVELREDIDGIINRVISEEKLVAPPPAFSVFSQQPRAEDGDHAHVYKPEAYPNPSL